MNRLGLLLVVTVVLSGMSAAIAEPMENGPYLPPTEPYVACSRDGFSGVQGQNNWYYGYIGHNDTWSNDLPGKVVLFDWYDGGMQAWRSTDQSSNRNLLYINKLGQTKAGGASPWNTVRYWVCPSELDGAITTADVAGGWFDRPDGSVSDYRIWVKHYDASAATSSFVGEIWQAGDNLMAYWYMDAVVNTGDWIAFGVGHSGVDQSTDGQFANWHQHITPEPTGALLLLAGVSMMLRRKQRA